MGLSEAVQSVLTKYSTFTGRARRSEFWYWHLALFVASMAFLVLIMLFGGSGFVGDMISWGYLLVSLSVIVPSLAVLARRLHDTGRSGYWMLLALIPLLGVLVLISFLLLPSVPGGNEYGPHPA